MQKYFILWTALCFFCFRLEAHELDKFINHIPAKDKQKLEKLFYGLINCDHFGYTLFGDKPVALSGHSYLTYWENFLSFQENEGLFWDSWNTWERYRMHFSFQNYLLHKEPSPFLDGGLIILINKKAFIESIKAHLVTFENILKHPIDPEKFLQGIESGKQTLMESIACNTTLLGILLGYGKQNSVLYSHKRKVFNASCLNGNDDDLASTPLLRIRSLCFMADLKSLETQLLHQKYSEMRRKLSSIYAGENFFKTSLKRLMGES